MNRYVLFQIFRLKGFTRQDKDIAEQADIKYASVPVAV